jgi:hypothetical protein
MSSSPSCRDLADLSPHARLTRRRVLAGVGLLTGLLLAPLISPAGAGTSNAQAAGVVHARIQGHIVALSTTQLKVRDRRGLVHTVILNSTTTYWNKLTPKTVHDLKMGMRVYVTGLPNADGTVTAIRIHLYYPQPSKAKKAKSTG